MEFWNDLAFYIHQSCTNQGLGKSIDRINNTMFRSEIIPAVFQELTGIIISRMAKPQEVLVVVDENGNAVEELISDSETVALYNS